MNASTKRMMKLYLDVLQNAQEIVQERTRLGRNDVIPLPGMFPRGISDAVYMCYQKACRALGGSDQTAEEELLDIINYAAFGVALRRLQQEQETKNEPNLDSPDPEPR